MVISRKIFLVRFCILSPAVPGVNCPPPSYATAASMVSYWLMVCDFCQAVVALSQDVDLHAVINTIKSCDGAEVVDSEFMCHLRSVLFCVETRFYC